VTARRRIRQGGEVSIVVHLRKPLVHVRRGVDNEPKLVQLPHIDSLGSDGCLVPYSRVWLAAHCAIFSS